MYIVMLFIVAKHWKQPKYPSANEWIKKWWYLYIMEYYTAVKKKERKGSLSFHYSMDKLQNIMLMEISQSMKDKYHMISLITGS